MQKIAKAEFRVTLKPEIQHLLSAPQPIAAKALSPV
jgi:hypothetical protein